MRFRFILSDLSDYAANVFFFLILVCPIVLSVAYRQTGNDLFLALMGATAIFWVLAWGYLFVFIYTIRDQARRSRIRQEKREAEERERERLRDERRRVYERRQRRENQGHRSSSTFNNKATNGSSETTGSVSTEELKRLFRAAAMKVHPDLAVDDEDRERRTALMRSVNKAYEDKDADALRRFSTMNI